MYAFIVIINHTVCQVPRTEIANVHFMIEASLQQSGFLANYLFGIMLCARTVIVINNNVDILRVLPVQDITAADIALLLVCLRIEELRSRAHGTLVRLLNKIINAPTDTSTTGQGMLFSYAHRSLCRMCNKTGE